MACKITSQWQNECMAKFSHRSDCGCIGRLPGMNMYNCVNVTSMLKKGTLFIIRVLLAWGPMINKACVLTIIQVCCLFNMALQLSPLASHQFTMIHHLLCFFPCLSHHHKKQCQCADTRENWATMLTTLTSGLVGFFFLVSLHYVPHVNPWKPHLNLW